MPTYALIVDNYDSFTYNLVHYFQMCEVDVQVVRNDDPLPSSTPNYLVISPGPGNPSQAGISNTLLARFHGKIPILGVCLGHQCIGAFFGARVTRAKAPMHGKTSAIQHDGKGLFTNIPNPFSATRYHSLIVDNLPPTLEPSATSDGEIMALRHQTHPTYGVQFHPESIATEHGLTLIQNFLGVTT